MTPNKTESALRTQHHHEICAKTVPCIGGAALPIVSVAFIEVISQAYGSYPEGIMPSDIIDPILGAC